MPKYVKGNIKPTGRKLKLLILGVVILLLCLIVVGFEITNTTHIFHRGSQEQLPTASQSTKGEPANNSTQTDITNNINSSNGLQPGDSKSPTGGSSMEQLVTPTGNFVSAHHISANTTITSVCNTTPGATCVITFTKGSLTKSLTPQITDRGGATFWNNWIPQDLGLSTGTWKITATAKLDSHTISANDAMDLVVTP